MIAICDNCKTVFQQNSFLGVSGAGNAQFSFSGCKIGPCPKCAGMGTVPDGIYQFIDDVFTLIDGPLESIEVLTKIKKLLYKNIKNPEQKDDIIKEISNLSPQVGEFIRKSPFVHNFHQWLSSIAAIVALLISIQQSYFKKEDKVTIEKTIIEQINIENKTINNLYIDNQLQNEMMDSVEFNKVKRKVGRNDSCFCGSGKKYKKCHGKISK